MNTIDATERGDKSDKVFETEAPALLTIILDTNPHAWALLESSLSLSKVVANLLVFINAHIAINHTNQVAVIASHAERAEFLYPTPVAARPEAANGDGEGNGGSVQLPDDPNKYRPFAHMEHAITTNLRKLMDSTSPEALSSTPATMMAGALTLALTYISKQSTLQPTTKANALFNYSDPTSQAGGNDMSAAENNAANALKGLTSRILILSVSGDLANQYIPIMNSIFACQRLNIPIDILKLAGDTVFLQQAADATGGIYIPLSQSSRPGLLQYLMFAYLPDQSAREHLIMPSEGDGVDFRAACFCHRKVVDIGYVCSICLSIFCEPLDGGECLTCGSTLKLGDFGKKPMVLAPLKKKKKKRVTDGVATPDSRAATPAA